MRVPARTPPWWARICTSCAITQREAAFDGSNATSVTLDVDPETARLLLQAAASATLGLAARAPATETPSVSASATPEVAQAPG